MQGNFHTLLAMITITLKSGTSNFLPVRRMSQEVVKPGFQGRKAGKASCNNFINHVSVIYFCKGWKELESFILLFLCFHLGVLLLK